MLKLKDKWIWDFWLTKEGNKNHIFYLQAPKSLIDERKRHHNATIGHAESTDLISWNVLPDAIGPSKNEAWDDLATWTGSVIKKGSKWYLFYTGVCKRENGLIQRIGVATSTDLIYWNKHPDNPIIEADSKWYELLDLTSWHDQAWRDPFVFSYLNNFYAVITARVNFGPYDERGVLAIAESSDLIKWKVHPPISDPGDFGQLEVPQILNIDGKNIIVFSTAIETTAKSRINKLPDHEIQSGIFYLESANNIPTGNYILPNSPLIYGNKHGSLYSGKIIIHNNKRYLMAFHNYNVDGEFLGYLSDPIHLSINF